MFKNCKCPTANMTDNRLILSLPDAITPVVWVMDINDAGSFVIKVERDANDLYILQKVSINDKKTEDVAYYKDKKSAIRALTTFTRMANGNNKSSNSGGFGHAIWSILKTLLYIALGLILIVAIAYAALFTYTGLTTPSYDGAIVQQQTMQPTQETNTDAVGVPMSADDFLNNNGSQALPF